MKLDKFNNEERIADFLEKSGFSLHEKDLKAAAKELSSFGVIDSPIKIGTLLYYIPAVLSLGVCWGEVFGIGFFDDNRIVVMLYNDDACAWCDLETCFFNYQEAQEMFKKLTKEEQKPGKKEEAEEWKRRCRERIESEKRGMVHTLSQRLKQNNFAGLSSEAIKILSSAIVSNGMIVAPVNIGDTVYQVFENDEESWIEEGIVTDITFDGYWKISVDNEDFENLDEYILTYEEAERVLNE